jgi:hypothetical protein
MEQIFKTNKPPYPVPCPDIDVMDKRWPDAFADWWCKKCDYYGIDPFDAFTDMLEADLEIKE